MISGDNLFHLKFWAIELSAVTMWQLVDARSWQSWRFFTFHRILLTFIASLITSLCKIFV